MSHDLYDQVFFLPIRFKTLQVQQQCVLYASRNYGVQFGWVYVIYLWLPTHVDREEALRLQAGGVLCCVGCFVSLPTSSLSVIFLLGFCVFQLICQEYYLCDSHCM